MSVYLMTEAVVHDVAAYEKYKAQAPQYVARHGGEYCCRGERSMSWSEIGIRNGSSC